MNQNGKLDKIRGKIIHQFFEIGWYPRTGEIAKAMMSCQEVLRILGPNNWNRKICLQDKC